MGIENFTVPIQKVENKSQEETQQPSIESIIQTSNNLKAKIEEAKKQKEINLNKKLTEREILLADLKSNEDLISETEKASEYFNSLSEVELNLLDETGKKELDSFKVNLTALKEQSRSINEVLNSIESNPEIVGKLHEQAVGEDNLVEAKKEEEREIEKYTQQIEELVKEIYKYGELNSKYKISIGKYNDSISSINKLVKDAKLKTVDDFDQKLYGIGPNLPLKEMKKQLSELRDGLGLFARKNKAAIDSILAGQEIFDKYEIYKKEREDLKTEIDTNRNELSQRYKDITSDMKNSQDKINKLKNSMTNWWESIPGKMEKKLKESIKEKNTNYQDIHLENLFKNDIEYSRD
jgi:hypothetical protein